MAKAIRKGLEAKIAALDGAEWDSDSDDSNMGNAMVTLGEAGEDQEKLDPPPLPLHAQKKGKRKGTKGALGVSVVPVGPAGQPSGVVYIGHIPHGFYEEAMNGFFKQFGDVVRLRISRSKKSGRCKGYAFVEFSSPEVAGIVAETMNGYYLFDKQLVSRVLRFDEIHPNLFDGAGVKFRTVNWHGLYRQKYNADRTASKDEKHVKKLLGKDRAKRAKLAKLGIEYDFPGFVASLKDREVSEEPFQDGAPPQKGKKQEPSFKAIVAANESTPGPDPENPSPPPLSVTSNNKPTLSSLKKVGKGTSKSPAKGAAKTPAKAAKTPTKATKNPTKATKTPTKATKTPTKATKTPTKTTKSPTKATKSPTKTTKTPTKAAKTPTKAVTSTPHTATVDGKGAASNITSVESSKSSKTPSKAAKSPSKAVKPPSQTPSKKTATGGKTTSAAAAVTPVSKSKGSAKKKGEAKTPPSTKTVPPIATTPSSDGSKAKSPKSVKSKKRQADDGEPTASEDGGGRKKTPKSAKRSKA